MMMMMIDKRCETLVYIAMFNNDEMIDKRCETLVYIAMFNNDDDDRQTL